MITAKSATRFDVQDEQTGATMYGRTMHVNALDLLATQGLSYSEATEWLADLLIGDVRVCGSLRIVGTEPLPVHVAL